ncbi:hypothetical protein ACFX1Q_010364 [Malus domestica]
MTSSSVLLTTTPLPTTPALPRPATIVSCGSHEQDSSSPSLQLSPSAHQFQAATATAKSPTSRLHRSSLVPSSVSRLAAATNLKDRCQTTSRSRSTIFSASLLRSLQIPLPTTQIYTEKYIIIKKNKKIKKGMVEQSGAATT